MSGFSGPLVLEFVDGRGVEGAGTIAIVREDFSFTSAKGQVWDVPAGTRTDGASIPQPLWSTVGSPFTGPYRRAAVVHDRYYGMQTRAKEDVDLIFLEAMLCDGTPIVLADVIFTAVSQYGRGAWDGDQIANIAALHAAAQAKIHARLAQEGV